MKIKLFILLALIALLGIPGAYADSIVSVVISDGINPDVVITDGDSDGFISFNSAIGAWTVVGSMAFGSDFLGKPGNMDLNYSAFTFNGTKSTVTIAFTQTDSTPAFPGWLLSVGGTQEAGMTTTYSAYYQNEGASKVQIGDTLSFPYVPDGDYSGSISGPADALAPFTLTQVIAVTGSGNRGDLSTGDAKLTPVPEPTSLALMGLGFAGLAFVGIRRKKSF